MNQGYCAEVYKAVEYVVDACTAIFSVAKACMPLLKYRRFIGCKVDPDCVAETKLELILLYAPPAVSQKLDFDGEEKVCSSAEIHGKAVVEIEGKRCLDVWDVPEGLSSMPTFPSPIQYYHSTSFGAEMLFQKARSNPANQQSG